MHHLKMPAPWYCYAVRYTEYIGSEIRQWIIFYVIKPACLLFSIIPVVCVLNAVGI